MGHGRGARTNETFWEDVRIPADSLIGEENRGWYIVSGALDLERVAIGTYRPLEKTVEDMVAYIKDRAARACRATPSPASPWRTR